jgi:three-Cys-motif partner protein
MAGNIRMDPQDGLPASEQQEWAEEKHDQLRRYLDISHPTRRKWLGRWGGATYIELFSGPGRSFIKSSGKLIDGSPVVAHREATRTKTNFSAIYLADDRKEFCDAVKKRLDLLGAKVQVENLKAEAAARRIVRALRGDALHVAFLDPYNLGDLPLTVFETFAPLAHIDLIVHVSAMDLYRALPGSMQAESAPLDRFDPGWREAIEGLPAGVEARGRIIEHWLGQIRALGYQDAKVWRLIRGPSNQPLYWLVLIAKHHLATKFWDDLNKSPQGGFGF